MDKEMPKEVEIFNYKKFKIFSKKVTFKCKGSSEEEKLKEAAEDFSCLKTLNTVRHTIDSWWYKIWTGINKLNQIAKERKGADKLKSANKGMKRLKIKTDEFLKAKKVNISQIWGILYEIYTQAKTKRSKLNDYTYKDSNKKPGLRVGIDNACWWVRTKATLVRKKENEARSDLQAVINELARYNGRGGYENYRNKIEKELKNYLSSCLVEPKEYFSLPENNEIYVEDKNKKKYRLKNCVIAQCLIGKINNWLWYENKGEEMLEDVENTTFTKAGVDKENVENLEEYLDKAPGAFAEGIEVKFFNNKKTRNAFWMEMNESTSQDHEMKDFKSTIETYCRDKQCSEENWMMLRTTLQKLYAKHDMKLEREIKQLHCLILFAKHVIGPKEPDVLTRAAILVWASKMCEKESKLAAMLTQDLCKACCDNTAKVIDREQEAVAEVWIKMNSHDKVKDEIETDRGLWPASKITCDYSDKGKLYECLGKGCKDIQLEKGFKFEDFLKKITDEIGGL